MEIIITSNKLLWLSCVCWKSLMWRRHKHLKLCQHRRLQDMFPHVSANNLHWLKENWLRYECNIYFLSVPSITPTCQVRKKKESISSFRHLSSLWRWVYDSSLRWTTTASALCRGNLVYSGPYTAYPISHLMIRSLSCNCGMVSFRFWRYFLRYLSIDRFYVLDFYRTVRNLVVTDMSLKLLDESCDLTKYRNTL
jgi:hypothetical protein